MTRVTERPLKGRRIWITRPEGHSRALSDLVRDAGGEALSVPAIEISGKPVSDREKRLLQGLARGDFAIFVSRNAARFISQVVAAPAAEFMGVNILAVGDGTRDALMEQGFTGVVSPDGGAGSEAMLELGLLQEASVRDRNIVILRGAGGRELLRDTLQRRGAKVGVVELYQRDKPRLEPATVKNLWRQSRPDVIVITSGDGLKNLVDITPERLRDPLFNTPLVVISDRVKDLALASGFRLAPQVAANAGDDELMEAILSLFRGNNR